MNIIKTPLQGVLVLEPQVFSDQRGYFQEAFHASRYSALGVDLPFVQDNLSRSKRGVLRGLHYQLQHPQAKLVSVVRGEIFDVAVDVRKNSDTFGQWYGIILDDSARRQLYIPPGFAHGFYVLSDEVDIFYKCTDYYHPASERSILWNDPGLNIDWPLKEDEVSLSEKDKSALPLSEMNSSDLPSI